MTQTHTHDGTVDKLKELLDLALQYGRRLQSPQTHYIHYYYHQMDHEVSHTIPLMENVLFILALFRSKSMENINEAKNLLERLLVFQNKHLTEGKGNFPLYLHEYPICRDKFLGVYLLAPFYWILKQFGSVLGQSLKKQLEIAIREIFIDAEQLKTVQDYPYSIAVRFAAAKHAFGDLWSDDSLKNQGQHELQLLQQLGQVDSWHSTDYLADLLVALQMVYPSIQNSPWDELWRYINHTWQQQTNAYVGPCVREEQKQSEPQLSVYDFFLTYFTGQSAARIDKEDLCYLQIALIQPSEDKIDPLTFPLTVQGLHRGAAWTMVQQPNWSYALLEKKSELHPNVARTYTPFRVVWGDTSYVHTFVYQGIDNTKMTYQIEDNSIHLIFELNGESELDSREKQREINFYLDFHPEAKILIDDQPASVFELGQRITIKSGERLFSMAFECLEGKGQFLGHLIRGNRPSQIDNRGENRFKAYDWHLFVRSVRREGKCVIKATFQAIH